ncbi:M1 family metallopeptidase [Paenibacillus yanchengensis]|uniref:M1 family metallopeptidase n=1 Tax=Paenibacillus yanchengensis TaxID=2035833 RepID=A0ABW4YP67_9BACL
MRPSYFKQILISICSIILVTLSMQDAQPQAWSSSLTLVSEEKAAQPVNEPVPNKLPASNKKPLSNRTVEYHISVKLRDDIRHLDGQQTITWHNPGRKPVTDLYFHLYANAFHSNQSTFMKESGGKLREDQATPASVGYMDVTSLTTLEGDSLLPRMQYVQPDDNNAQDKTMMRIRLPEPVAAGQSVTLIVGFTVKLPEIFARMGYYDNFVMAGQWFPKVAAYETSGMRGRTTEGWNLHQYHGNSEFYSNFAMYNVLINVPEDFQVAATGIQVKPATAENGRALHQYYAEDVHDFAWAASPHFLYEEYAFSEEGIPGVRLKLYLDPAHAALKERYIHAAKSALIKLAKWYGPYPYSTLSIVVPPKGASGAGGMEYPTLITAFAADKDNPGYELERVVIHETAHQYWYGMVASNEFEEAWLDEGFTSYSEDKIMEAVYGVVPNLRTEASFITDPAPLLQDAWKFDNHKQYAENVYIRSKLVLRDIENQIGDDQMKKVLRAYFQTFKFKHPSTDDFQATLEKITKQSWDEYFERFVKNNDTADYQVKSIAVKPLKKTDPLQYESNITVQRSFAKQEEMPVILKFKDGTTRTKLWNGKQEEETFIETHTAPLEWAMIDPQQINLLDNKLINNYMRTETPKEWRVRWNIGTVKIFDVLFKGLLF